MVSKLRMTWKQVLQLQQLHSKMARRTRDIEQLISISRHDLGQLTSMAEDISADERFRVMEEVQHNTGHLTEVSRASEQTNATLELMQIVPSPSNKYRDRVCKNLEMTGIYHTILKFPELDPDIYLTE